MSPITLASIALDFCCTNQAGNNVRMVAAADGLQAMQLTHGKKPASICAWRLATAAGCAGYCIYGSCARRTHDCSLVQLLLQAFHCLNATAYLYGALDSVYMHL